MLTDDKLYYLQVMKRMKPSSQPTRIMPRRGKTRENGNTDVGENLQRNQPFEDDSRRKRRKRDAAVDSNRSESFSETEASVSASAGNSRGGRRKNQRLDTESSLNSTSLPFCETLTSTDNRSSRESPEFGCSICLSAVKNRAFTDACYHTFCFECLVEWSRVRAVCPLCKKSFHSIIHSFRSYDDYELYQVPTSYVSNFVNNPNNSASSYFSRLRNTSNTVVSSTGDGDRMLAFRRRVYTHSEEMQLRGLWSSDGVVISPAHQASPAMFDGYPVMLERVRPWILRDVAVIIGNGDVQFVAGIVLDMLRHFQITSEDFYERLFPHLGLHTRRFLLELDAFAKSPFDMTTYDARVVYSSDSGVETAVHLPTEHIEDISSGDDSDIEIVSPAVVTSSESTTLSNHVNVMTDHAVPDLLHCLRAFQQNLLASFSLMHCQTSASGMESPVPGPSGLGRAVITNENDSVASHASRSAHDGEETSNSPMVLSDADSDVMVVDVDRPVHSPIHISSGEDEDAAEQIRTDRQHRRRKRRKRVPRDHRSENQSSDNIERTVKDEDLPAELELPQREPHATGHKSTDHFVESNVEEPIYAAEESQNSDEPRLAIIHMQNQSSSHSSNDHSVKLSPSEPYLQHDGGGANMAKHAFHHTHPKRSRSVNSVTSLPVVSMSSSDDKKPLTCKKHVSGHKSSKHKAKALVTENRSTEAVGNNTEKSLAGDQVPATGDNEQSPASLTVEVTVPSVGESSIAYADISSNSVPNDISSDEVMGEQKLAMGSHVDGGMPAPCTSEAHYLPSESSVDQWLSMADENSSCGPNANSSSDKLAQMHPLNAGELSETAAAVAGDENNMNCCNADVESAVVHSSDCIGPSNADTDCCVTEPVHSTDVLQSCVNAISLPSSPVLPSSSGPCEPIDSSSETSCNVSISLATSCSFDTHIQSRSLESSLSFVPEESGSMSFANSNSHADPELNRNASVVCADGAAAESQTLPSRDSCGPICGVTFAGCKLVDSSLIDQHQSSNSASSIADLLSNESPVSPESPNLVINDSILIGSPAGAESSDSEVELLETGGVGRQRCISISSSGSSIVYNSSDSDGMESLLSDSDGLEMLDDEPQTAYVSETRSAEYDHLYETCDDQPPLVNSELLPSAMSDVDVSVDTASSASTVKAETVVNAEQMNSERKEQARADDDPVEATNITEKYSGDDAVHSNSTADGCNPVSDSDSDTDAYFSS